MNHSDKDVPFLGDLRKTLTLLGPILDKLKDLKDEKEKYREQIRSWMELNNLTEFDIMDSENERSWKLTISEGTRRSADFTYLNSILSEDQYNAAVTESTTTTFKCNPGKAKVSSKSARKGAPST